MSWWISYTKGWSWYEFLDNIRRERRTRSLVSLR